MTNTPSHPDANASSPHTRVRVDGVAVDASAFSNGLRIWEQETSRFLEELIQQDRRTLDQLCECKSPLDVLAVEQNWVRARSRTYLESGLRFAQAFAEISRETLGEGASPGPEAYPAVGRITPNRGDGVIPPT